jgi:hypothetical protein
MIEAGDDEPLDFPPPGKVGRHAAWPDPLTYPERNPEPVYGPDGEEVFTAIPPAQPIETSGPTPTASWIKPDEKPVFQELLPGQGWGHPPEKPPKPARVEIPYQDQTTAQRQYERDRREWMIDHPFQEVPERLYGVIEEPPLAERVRPREKKALGGGTFLEDPHEYYSDEESYQNAHQNPLEGRVRRRFVRPPPDARFPVEDLHRVPPPPRRRREYRHQPWRKNMARLNPETEPPEYGHEDLETTMILEDPHEEIPRNFMKELRKDERGIRQKMQETRDDPDKTYSLVEHRKQQARADASRYLGEDPWDDIEPVTKRLRYNQEMRHQILYDLFPIIQRAEGGRKVALERMFRTVASYDHDPYLVSVMHPPKAERGRYNNTMDHIVHHIGKAVRVRHRRALRAPDGRLWSLNFDDEYPEYDPEVKLRKWVGRYNDRVARHDEDDSARIKWMMDRGYRFDFEDPEGFFDPVDVQREIEQPEQYRMGGWHYETGY